MTNFMDRHFRYLKAGQKEYTEEEVRLIINGAIAEEREACAVICENDEDYSNGDVNYHSTLIRARGQHD